MKSEIIVSDREYFEKVKENIKKGGSEGLHILADFDRTLTYAHSKEGEFIAGLMAILRNGDYLSQDYVSRAHGLFEKYHPIEVDGSVSIEDKKSAMESWWREHYELLFKSGLNMKDLKDVVGSGIARLRRGVRDSLFYLSDRNVPLVIMSATGIGNMIPMLLENERVSYENIYVISNMFEFDEKGGVSKLPEETIHSLNKDETAVLDYPIFDKIRERRNVVLLGDGLGDVGMISGFDYENLIKIGFLNKEPDDSELELYKKNFDIVITGDGDFDFIDKLIRGVV